jgi:hypothetical protein
MTLNIDDQWLDEAPHMTGVSEKAVRVLVDISVWDLS